jgi:hypothetical protein
MPGVYYLTLRWGFWFKCFDCKRELFHTQWIEHGVSNRLITLPSRFRRSPRPHLLYAWYEDNRVFERYEYVYIMYCVRCRTGYIESTVDILHYGNWSVVHHARNLRLESFPPHPIEAPLLETPVRETIFCLVDPDELDIFFDEGTVHGNTTIDHFGIVHEFVSYDPIIQPGRPAPRRQPARIEPRVEIPRPFFGPEPRPETPPPEQRLLVSGVGHYPYGAINPNYASYFPDNETPAISQEPNPPRIRRPYVWGTDGENDVEDTYDYAAAEAQGTQWEHQRIETSDQGYPHTWVENDGEYRGEGAYDEAPIEAMQSLSMDMSVDAHYVSD